MPWTPWIAALAPLALISAALLARAPLVPTASRIAAWAALAGGLSSLVLALGSGVVVTPLIGAGGLGLALRIDPLSGVLSSLIGLIGVVVIDYSRNYLAGDARQAWFVRHLCLALAFVQGLVLSGNLAGLVLCWIGVGFSLNRLLLFRAERMAAVLAARKRRIASLLSNGCLIGAAGLMWRAAGSGDIGTILSSADGGGAWAAAAALVAAAAVLASAQLPFHGWILEVMETPTPVSALLHAGVVNAGGFLVLRFAEVMALQPAVMLGLAVVGGLTALFGSLVMLAQTSVKVGLAYSTIAQMGFMLLECGLGAFSAALLHIVAHAAYKAYAFLSAGELARRRRADPAAPILPRAVAVAAPLAVLGGSVAAAVLGAGPAESPGAYVLGGVVALTVVRVWLDAGRAPGRGVLPAVLLTGAALVAYAAGQALFARLFDVWASGAQTVGTPQVALAIGVVAAMTALVALQGRMARTGESPLWRRAYPLVANGFYLNTFANRWVLQFWPAAPKPSVKTGVCP